MFRITYRVSRFPKRVSETCQATSPRQVVAPFQLFGSRFPPLNDPSPATVVPAPFLGVSREIRRSFVRVRCVDAIVARLLDYPVWLYDSSYEDLAQRHLPVRTGSTS